MGIAVQAPPMVWRWCKQLLCCQAETHPQPAGVLLHVALIGQFGAAGYTPEGT